MAEETAMPEDERVILAGEYALGVLEGDELAAAKRAVLADPGFARAVQWWEWRLGALAEAGEVYEPSAAVWDAISARIDGLASAQTTPLAVGSAGSAEPSSFARRWGVPALFGGLAMALVSIAVLITVITRTPAPSSSPAAQPMPDTAQPSAPVLVAQLNDAEAERRVASVIDPNRRRLALTITGLEPEQGRTPELWVIPDGSAPVSLGAIPGGGQFERALSERELDLLAAGAQLAVTFEQDDGTRHAEPSPPILLVGPLDRV